MGVERDVRQLRRSGDVEGGRPDNTPQLSLEVQMPTVIGIYCTCGYVDVGLPTTLSHTISSLSGPAREHVRLRGRPTLLGRTVTELAESGSTCNRREGRG